MTLRLLALAASSLAALVGVGSGCVNSKPQACSQSLQSSQQPLAKAPRNGAQFGGMAIGPGGISEGSGAPSAAADAGYGVIRIYVILSAPGAGLTNVQRSALTDTLNEIKSTGVLQAFLRFYYQEPLTSKADGAATALKIRADIDSAKPSITPFLDLIPFIQAGFLGPWGEWWGGDLEGSDFGGDQDLRALKTGVVNGLKSAFPNTFIQLRYPRDIATYYEGDPQVAFHDDSVLAGSDDGGTFNPTKKCPLWPDGDPGKQRAWIKERSNKLSSFNAGEASENTPDVSCDALLAYLKEYRIAVFNAQWPQVVTKCAGQLKGLAYTGPLAPGANPGGGGSGAVDPDFGTELGCWATDQRPWQLCSPEGCEAERCRRAAADTQCQMFRASACKGSWPPPGYPGEESVPTGSGGAAGKGGGGSSGGVPSSGSGGNASGGAATSSGGLGGAAESAAAGRASSAGGSSSAALPNEPVVNGADDGGCE